MSRFSSDSQKIINLQYIADLECFETEKPYRINDIELDPHDNIQLTNIEFETRDVILLNLRNQQGQLDFDKCGFKYIDFPASNTPGFEDESIIAYSNEAIELLDQHVNADKVLCYDLRLRRHSPIRPKTWTRTDRSIPDEPIEAVHIDHTRRGGWLRVAHHLTPEEQEKLLNHQWRIRIFNIWRPLVEVIKDMPLAICDPQTVSEDDLVAVNQIGPGFNAEIYYLRPSNNHKWYWLGDQSRDEALLFQSWDSHSPGGRLNFCPHASFKDPSAPADAPPRESVEVRLIAFTMIE